MIDKKNFITKFSKFKSNFNLHHQMFKLTDVQSKLV